MFEHTSIPSLEIAVRGLSERQTAISSNIANVSTPGYKAKYTSFEDNLQQAIQAKRTNEAPLVTTHTEHMQIGVTDLEQVQIETEEDLDSVIHSGGNNVDIDSQMVELGRTGMQYRAVARMAEKQFQRLRSTIRGGS